MTSVYYTLKCKSCGKFGVKEVRKSVLTASFRCKFCNKNNLLMKKNRKTPGLDMINYGPFVHPIDASLKVQEEHKKMWEKSKK